MVEPQDMSTGLAAVVIVTLIAYIDFILTYSHDVKGSKEKVLIRDLLRRYDAEGQAGRPVAHASDKILVNFSVSLIQIVDVDEKNQILKTNIWYHYKWPDFLLQWKPEHHENITSVRVPPNRIWLPDIVLYNFADNRLSEQRDALVVVGHTGDLMWMPQAILNSSCSFNTLYFPFDEQICHLKFGSWSYNADMLDIDFIGDARQMDLSDYIDSNEWTITQNTALKNVKYYTCCPEPYTDVIFTLKFRRRAAFYGFILILPCSLLSLLTLVIFWVPPESPAKLQLGMNLFLAFFLLLLLLADHTPRAATSIPLIGAYFCFSMIMITMSTILACTVANLYSRGVGVYRAPRWLRACVIESAAMALCVHEVIEETNQQPVTPRKTWSTYVTGEKRHSDPETLVAKTHLLTCHAGSRLDVRDYGAFQEVTNEFCQPSTSTALSLTPSSASSSDDIVLAEEVSLVREILEDELDASDQIELSRKHIKEWHMIACVMDRIFFTAYICINVISLTAMILRSYLL